MTLNIILTALAAIVTYKIVKKFTKPRNAASIPQLESTWWGRGPRTADDAAIRPFTINISQEIISDLQHRLSTARPFIPPLEGIQHQYGINTNLLQEIVTFWKDQYNWTERQTFLNQFPQFLVQVQGLNIHYLHVKPSNPQGLKVLPILLLHGWPGSVREFYEIIPLLTTPQPGRDFIFEVIVPSLPGYGFSEATVRPGLGVTQMAVLFNNLMKTIGFNKYYIQGGDWGGVIVQNMGVLFPREVIGLHSNFCMANMVTSSIKLFFYSYWPSLFLKKEEIPKVYPMKDKFFERVLETGYMHLQATKPDTIGVGLNDSPVGLAAYILEKFITWTNPALRDVEDGGLSTKYDYNKLLDNVMIYWVTNSITTSMRIYAETFNKSQVSELAKLPITVPSSVARFTYDLTYSPTSILKEKYQNIVHEFDYDGGHFAAFELPDIMAKDIYDGIEQIELYHKKHHTQ